MHETLKLVELLADKRAVLFDFDGPICGVFAGLPAADIAAELVALLRRLDVEVTPEQDPMEVLRCAATAGPAVTRAVEDVLCAAELAAVAAASPTPGGAESVLACLAAGKTAAIVSNNSAAAVHRYLDSHGLTGKVWPVVGRPYAEPDRMKPNPEPLERTLARLSVAAGDAVLIGDSVTDVEASRAAGVACIAYANKPPKLETLARADVLVTDMAVVARTLRGLVPGERVGL